MARSSQAKGSRAARAMTAKAPTRRPAVHGKAGRTEPTPATGAVALAEPEAKPEALASAPSPAPAEPAAPEAPLADDLGAASRELDEPADGPSAAADGRSTAVEPAVPSEADRGAAEAAAPEPAAPAEPVPAAAEPSPIPWVAGQGPDLSAMFQAGRTLVEGSIRVRSQMIGFGCRRAEHGLAVGRAMLAGGSLPKVLALQVEYLQGAVDDALAQTLELGRLSADVVRTGLGSFRPR